jgi:transposase-like protein
VGAGHEADTEEAQRGVQGEGGGSGNQRRPDRRQLAVHFGVHPNQIHNWKKQLLDGAVSVFEGGAAAEGATNEAQVDLLYRQIGQLKVENDFLARKLGN